MPMLIEIAVRGLLIAEVTLLIAGVVALIVGVEVLRYKDKQKQEEAKNA